MGYYIIIRGPLGAGKTTVSRGLATELRAHYISTDEILEKHDLEVWEAGYVSLASFIRVNEIASRIALKYLENGRTVIFDGNFYYRSQIEDLQNRLRGYASQVFTLRVTLHTCIERDAMRKQSFGAQATREVFEKSTEFSFGTDIDASGSLADTISIILSKLSMS